MRAHLSTGLWILGSAVIATAAVAGQTPPPPPPPPVPPTPIFVREAMDRPLANQTPEPQGTGVILGTVISAGTGQPVDGVRVTLSGGELRNPRQSVTDDDGRFGFTGLPAGELTLRAAKTGYVSVAFGQKEPRAGWPGTPIQLADGQQIKNLSFSIPPGGVITGVVFDEKNRPSVATPVRILRWSMQSGERALTSAGSASTDDRGMYRVYGLAPGDYLVTALPRAQAPGEMVFHAGDMGYFEEMSFRSVTVSGTMTYSGGGVEQAMIVRPEPAPGVQTQKPPTEGYAPVYYPGTPQLSAAATVTVRASEERSGVDVRLMRVPLSIVEGQVGIPPGPQANNVQVRLINASDQVPGVGTQSARAGNDGRFRFTSVPPGQYRVVATAEVRETSRTQAAPGQPQRTVTTSSRLWASADVSVSGGPAQEVTLGLAPGMKVSGRATFEAGAAPMPTDLRRVRLTLSSSGAMAAAMGTGSQAATLEPDGTFTFNNVIPGTYRLRAAGATGWTVESALVGGRDALDFPLEVSPGADLTGMLVTFSDRTSTVSGTLQDALGRPTADYMVVLFPAHEQYWVGQSRRIHATRPGTNGRFSFSGLPAGEYRLAAVSDVEPGTWYDPAFLRQLAGASIPLSLAKGQTKAQDVKVAR